MLFNNIFLLFFVFFAILAIISALMVIISINPIHSVLWLVLVFALVTCMFFLLQVDFIAIIFLMIYVGAISVLFLFVIMMLNIKITEINETVLRYLPIGFIIGFVFLTILLSLLNIDLNVISITDMNILKKHLLFTEDAYLNWYQLLNSLGNIQIIGLLLYNYFFIYYLIGGMILLLAMIGTIILTLNSASLINRQVISDQLYMSNTVLTVNFVKAV